MLNQADLIFYGGDIITMDESNPSVEALAVKQDKIVEAGKLGDIWTLKGPSTQVIYLDQKTLLPGFIEPHQHAVLMAEFRSWVNVGAYYYNTFDEIEAKIKDEIAKADSEADPLPWCVFFGWDPELIEDMPTLNADFLDGFSKDIPILVLAQNLHVCWANHKALEVAGIDDDIQDAHGGVFVKDKDNRLTGQLKEEPAIRRIYDCKPLPTDEQLQMALREQWKAYASCGFTTVTELSYSPSHKLNALLETQASSADCPLRLAVYRVVCGPDADSPAETVCQENEMFWEAGVKIFADGSPHCGSAAVREPYLESDLAERLGFPPAPAYGALNFTTEQLRETVKFFHDRKRQVAIHANGDRAVDQVVSVYEQVLDSQWPKDKPHRVEHAVLATEDALARAAKLNLAVSFFVYQLYFYAKTFEEHIFGEDRTKRLSPLSLATKYGIRWTIHQDQPGFPGPPLPFANMKTAVTRTQRDDEDTVYGPEYRVSIDEAVKAYTINAAWQLHKEDTLGSLTKNKKADLVILSQNPYKVDPKKLDEIQVVQTFLNGRPTNASENYLCAPMNKAEKNCYFYKRKN